MLHLIPIQVLRCPILLSLAVKKNSCKLIKRSYFAQNFFLVKHQGYRNIALEDTSIFTLFIKSKILPLIAAKYWMQGGIAL